MASQKLIQALLKSDKDNAASKYHFSEGPFHKQVVKRPWSRAGLSHTLQLPLGRKLASPSCSKRLSKQLEVKSAAQHKA